MIPGVSQFGGYIKNLAQNVRDVGTAVGTNIQIARYGGSKSMQGGSLDRAGGANMGRQIKEVGGAILGQPGTRSDQYSQKGGYVSGK